jgi:hypothetical protein
VGSKFKGPGDRALEIWEGCSPEVRPYSIEICAVCSTSWSTRSRRVGRLQGSTDEVKCSSKQSRNGIKLLETTPRPITASGGSSTCLAKASRLLASERPSTDTSITCASNTSIPRANLHVNKLVIAISTSSLPTHTPQPPPCPKPKSAAPNMSPTK